MTTGIPEILTGVTEFIHCYEILTQERDDSMDFSLEEKTWAFMEIPPRPKSDLYLNP